MKSHTLCVALALATAPATALAQGRPAKPAEFTPSVPPYALQTTVLDLRSGMRIMFQADHTHPVVGVFAMVNHGTKDDPSGKEELAHFAEHTWFRSQQLQFPSIMNFVFDYGTLFNATTWNDWTDYRTVANKKYTNTLLQLENARLNGAYKGVTDEMIDVEREVIRNEWRRRNEQSQALFLDFMYESIYPKDHPYHDHSTHSSIDNIKLADLQKWFDEYYHPDQTTIFVVGDFDDRPQALVDYILRNFDLKNVDPRLTEADTFLVPREEYGDIRPSCKDKDGKVIKDCHEDPDTEHYWYVAWDPEAKDKQGNRLLYNWTLEGEQHPAPRITQEPTAVPQLGTTEVLTRQGPFENKAVAIGWSLPGGYRDDSWNLQVLGFVSGNVVASGLNDLVQAKKVGDVGCFANPEIVNTTLICYADILDKDLDPLQVRDQMLDQFSELWNPDNVAGTGMNAQFFNQSMQRAKLEGLRDSLLDLDLYAQVFGGRAESLLPHAHYNDFEHSGRTFSDAMNSFMQIEPGLISKLAHQYLKRDRAATVIMEPLPQDEIDVGSEKSSYSGSAVTDAALAFSGDLKAVTKELIEGDYLVPDLSSVVDYTLPNGLRVVIKPHGVAPVVETRLVLGRNLDGEKQGWRNFVAEFTTSPGNDGLPIAAQLSWAYWPGVPGLQPGQGFPMYTPSRPNAWYFDVKAPSGNLDGALWLMREEMEEAHPSLDGQYSYFKSLKKEIEGNWADAGWHTADAVSKYLYPDSPSHNSLTWEEMEAQRAWTGGMVADYLGSTMRPDNATLIVVGNIEDVEKAKKDVEAYFGGWKPRAGAPAAPTAMTAPGMPTEGTKILLFDDPKLTQSQVTAFCRLDLTGAPEEEAAVELVSSLMGDRIFNEIRVHRGLAYSPGAYASIEDDGAGEAVFYSDGVVNRGAAEILQYYRQVMTEVKEGKFAADELVVAKIRASRSDGLAWQSVGQVTSRLANLVADKKSFSVVANKGKDLAAVDVAQVQKVLQSCVDHHIVTIEGPKDVIAPQLDELGLAYQVVEWRANGDELLWKYDPKEAKKKQKKKLKAERKKAKEQEKEDKKGDAPAPASPVVTLPVDALRSEE